jgi:hypothetical protein
MASLRWQIMAIQAAGSFGVITVSLNERARRFDESGPIVFDSAAELSDCLKSLKNGELYNKVTAATGVSARDLKDKSQLNKLTAPQMPHVRNVDYSVDMIVPQVGHVKLDSPPTEKEVTVALDTVISNLSQLQADFPGVEAVSSDMSVKTSVMKSVLSLLYNPNLLDTVVQRMMDDKIVYRSPEKESAVVASSSSSSSSSSRVASEDPPAGADGTSSLPAQPSFRPQPQPKLTKQSKKQQQQGAQPQQKTNEVVDDSNSSSMWGYLTSLVPRVPTFPATKPRVSDWTAMEDKYSCAICHDVMAAPVILPCSHDFCAGCVEDMNNAVHAHSLDVEVVRTCPCCRAEYTHAIYQRTLDADIHEQVLKMDEKALSTSERSLRAEWLKRRKQSLKKIKKTLEQRESELRTEIEADELIEDAADITLVIIVAATTLALIAWSRLRK